MDHLLRRVGLDPTLTQYNAYTHCKEISKSDFPQFLGSLPCTKRSIERHLFPLIYQHIVFVTLFVCSVINYQIYSIGQIYITIF